ncbi:MAG: single-stranded-DNA-specific exonuclease RecJ [Chloroflexi bacterium]|nr:single-stranded-DNA-specific exonuclease RecJ [Chloroflexota bacterium]
MTLSITGKRWEISKRAPRSVFSKNADLPPLAVQLLHNRSYKSREQIESVLDNSEPPHDPFLMSGMEEAVERILRALQSRETICVYADYDADGVSGAAVLISMLRSLGADPRSYFPKRLEEGYGLNERAIRAIRESGADVLISTDCGANAVQEIAVAAELGLDVIVTDHHIVHTDLPGAAAAINPHHPGEPYPFDGLAGVGVAYKLAEAVLLEAEIETAVEAESLLDFVALGTVADVVPLRGENRWLVREGLSRLNRSPRAGMAALIDAAGVEPGDVTSTDIAFRLGPRINAAGRMKDAAIALELLLQPNVNSARRQAAVLNDLNRQRQRATDGVLDEISTMTPATGPILAHGADWPLGVLGLAAGRLVSETGRPAFVSSGQAGDARGSARGPEGANVSDTLKACADVLERFGGHERAAGFSLEPERVGEFHDAVRRYWAESDQPQAADLTLNADCRLLPRTISFETLDLHQALEPFGEGFREPVYVTSGLTLGRADRVGNNQNHLKLMFRDIPVSVSPIWFGMGMVADELALGARYDVAFRLGKSWFRGEPRVDLFVEDMRTAS